MFLGRVVGSGDSAWLDSDRGYALAWQANKAATCGNCGTRQDQWDGDEHAFISDHYTCPGCARLQEELDNNLDPSGEEGKPAPGQHAFLVPRDLYEARQAAGVTD